MIQVIYCGTIVTEEGKEKKVNIDFEPFKPINTSLYLCDNKFHTEALTALLADDNRWVICPVPAPVSTVLMFQVVNPSVSETRTVAEASSVRTRSVLRSRM